MFNVPDTADAAATCPPFKAVGPKPAGFFADCDPAANFDGTRPIADHFNELIVNLHALAVQAGNITGPKGDPTILWRCIQGMQRIFTIDTAVDLYVSPTGSSAPADPLGGDPFDSLLGAFVWLGYRSITARGSVTIHLADGTYTQGTPLVLHHADGMRITVAGTSASTQLSFPYSSGIQVPGPLAAITNVTILGANVAGSIGLHVTGSLTDAANVTVNSFGAQGVVVENNGYLGFDTLNIDNSGASGLGCFQGGVVVGNTLNVLNAAYHGGAAAWDSGVFIQDGGRAWITTLAIHNCNKGIMVSGTGAELRVASMTIAESLVGPVVEANDGGAIINSGPGNVGDWSATNSGGPVYFWANVYALIRADGAFSAANKANCSPAANTTGNISSYILTT